ncbi:MAG: hypothetical protein JXR94_11785 [Candidatus Hydrogenedentes bacterium]|nr:hypothetical protein [Candidatus Hydrogenedentota bacterium]
MKHAALICGMTLLTLGWAQSASGMGQPGADINLWPVLIVDSDESGPDVRVLIPLGQFTSKDGTTVSALRPLFIWRREGEEDQEEHALDLLWPLMRFEHDPDGETDGRAVPVFWGADTEGGHYMDVFPVLWSWWNETKTPGESRGTVVGPAWLARDYGDTPDWSAGLAPISWAWRNDDTRGLWAAPVYWEKDDSAEHERTFAIMPLLLDWRDGAERGTWLLPVYWGRESGKTKVAIVFPVFWRGANSVVVFPVYWDFKDSQLLVVFPLYGHKKGDDKVWRAVLWPAYVMRRDGEYRSHDVLWPVLSWGGDGQDRKDFRLWPLAGWRRSAHNCEDGRQYCTRRQWALWPLIWRGRTEWDRGAAAAPSEPAADEVATHVESRYFDVFPLYWSECERTSTPGGGEQCDSAMNCLVPLYTYDRSPEETEFTLLWPLWRQAHTKEKDRYSVLWRVVDAQYFTGGDKRISVLWRGYRNERRGDTHDVDVFPFTSFRAAPGRSRLQFLAGFFQYGKEDGQRYLRLLYSPRIPLGGRNGASAGSEPAE